MSALIRGKAGRFLPGTAPGPGRPPRPTEAAYLRELSAAVPLDTWRRIVEAAVRGALAGDAKSRDWLSKYLIGESPGLVAAQAADLVGADPALDKAAEIVARQRMAEADSDGFGALDGAVFTVAFDVARSQLVGAAAGLDRQ